MILLRTSTEADIFERLNKIYSTQKHAKLIESFNRKGLVKDRRIPDGTFLGHAVETICGSRVHVFAQKRSYRHNGAYCACAVFSEMVEAMDPRTGTTAYLSPLGDDRVKAVILFTPHFVKRLEERTGTTFFDYNSHHTHLTVRWVDNDGTFKDGNKYTVFGDLGYAVGGQDDDCGLIKDYAHDKSKIIVARTFITDVMRFRSQAEKMDEEKREFYKFEKEKKDNFHQLTTPPKKKPYRKSVLQGMANKKTGN